MDEHTEFVHGRLWDAHIAASEAQANTKNAVAKHAIGRSLDFIQAAMVSVGALATDKLKCGCSVHGHKCLASQGGCGRCVEHCACD